MTLTRGQKIALIVSLVFALPALTVGYYADDWIHEARLRGVLHGFDPTWFNLFEFGREGDVGGTPGPHTWWTGPVLKVRFFRPLTSMTVALDHRLGPVLGHVHGLLWFALLLWLAARFLRRVLPEREATIATLVYAMGEHHAATYTWISGRTSALVGALSLLALEAHASARDRGKAVPIAGLCAYALALLGGEGSLGALAWLWAFEWLRAREKGARLERDSLLKSMGGYAVITVGYLAFYALAGYGTKGSAAYRNPISDPLSFAMAAPERALMLVGDAFTGMPSDFHTLTDAAYRASVAWGVIVSVLSVLLIVWARKKCEPVERSRIDAMLLGFFGSMAPGLGAPPGGRVIVLSALGTSSLLAMLFVRAQQRWRLDRSKRALAALGFVGLFHFAFAPLMRLAQPMVLRPVVSAHEQLTARSRLAPHCGPRDEVLLIAAPDPIVGLYGNILWALQNPGQTRLLRPLSTTPADHRMLRTDPQTIELESVGRPFGMHPLERLVRDPRLPYTVGMSSPLQRVGHLAPFPGQADYRAVVTVLALEQGYPSRLRVRFDREIERAGACFATGFAGEVRSMSIPAVGETRLLRYAPGAMGL